MNSNDFLDRFAILLKTVLRPAARAGPRSMEQRAEEEARRDEQQKADENDENHEPSGHCGKRKTRHQLGGKCKTGNDQRKKLRQFRWRADDNAHNAHLKDGSLFQAKMAITQVANEMAEEAGMNLVKVRLNAKQFHPAFLEPWYQYYLLKKTHSGLGVGRNRAMEAFKRKMHAFRGRQLPAIVNMLLSRPDVDFAMSKCQELLKFRPSVDKPQALDAEDVIM